MLTLPLKKDAAARIAAGYPWIFKSDVVFNSALELADPGTQVQVLDTRSKPLGVAYFSPRVALCARMLSANARQPVGHDFFLHTFRAALHKRDMWFAAPYYRLAYAESDGVPGLIVDRFGDYLSCQVTTAGMWMLKDAWLAALDELLAPKGILVDHSDDYCKREGLPLGVDVVGTLPEIVALEEHGRTYFADMLHGQKTGWFFDQRSNHTYVQSLAEGRTVIDLYCHSGGFGIAAAMGGAAHVTMVDRSELALDLARKAGEANNVAGRCNTVRADVFKDLESRIAGNETFSLVIADPPAFIQAKDHLRQGLAGYQKVARLCAQITAPGGLLCLASCSHFAHPDTFRQTVEDGLRKAGRTFERLHISGADQDHPVHPHLPESRYLKFIAYRLD